MKWISSFLVLLALDCSGPRNTVGDGDAETFEPELAPSMEGQQKKDETVERDWRTSLLGDPARALARNTPEFGELEMLRCVLTPSQGTRDDVVDRIFGQPAAIFQPTDYDPFIRKRYSLGHGVHLSVRYKDGQVARARLAHTGLANESPKPGVRVSYADLLKNQETRLHQLGEVMLSLTDTKSEENGWRADTTPFPCDTDRALSGAGRGRDVQPERPTDSSP